MVSVSSSTSSAILSRVEWVDEEEEEEEEEVVVKLVEALESADPQSAVTILNWRHCDV